jgi:hypothetical protein
MCGSVSRPWGLCCSAVLRPGLATGWSYPHCVTCARGPPCPPFFPCFLLAGPPCAVDGRACNPAVLQWGCCGASRHVRAPHSLIPSDGVLPGASHYGCTPHCGTASKSCTWVQPASQAAHGAKPQAAATAVTSPLGLTVQGAEPVYATVQPSIKLLPGAVLTS